MIILWIFTKSKCTTAATNRVAISKPKMGTQSGFHPYHYHISSSEQAEAPHPAIEMWGFFRERLLAHLEFFIMRGK